MIYIITLNPAIDQIILTDEPLVLDKTNYYQDEYFVVGGKGINAGIILQNLEAPVTALGILGEDNKSVFLEKFATLGLQYDFLYNTGKTRTNYKIKNLRLKQETELNGLGFETSEKNVNELLAKLETMLQANDIVITTGSIARNIATDIYAKIGQIANAKKALFICDAANAVLKATLSAHPYLIKPNLDELVALLDEPECASDDFATIQKLIAKVQHQGARNVLLSMGSHGSYYFSETGAQYQVGIAKGTLVNSVGAGDSMLAGFVYGIANNLPIEQTLQYAAAAGGATAFTEWLAQKEAILQYVPTITVAKIN